MQLRHFIMPGSAITAVLAASMARWAVLAAIPNGLLILAIPPITWLLLEALMALVVMLAYLPLGFLTGRYGVEPSGQLLK